LDNSSPSENFRICSNLFDFVITYIKKTQTKVNLEAPRSGAQACLFNSDWDGTDHDHGCKNHQEETPAMVKHFGKEIPPESDVGRQVWHGETVNASPVSVNSTTVAGCTYVAPHVSFIHRKLPAINVDIPMRASMHSGNTRGCAAPSLYFIAFPSGCFKFDCGPENSRR